MKKYVLYFLAFVATFYLIDFLVDQTYDHWFNILFPLIGMIFLYFSSKRNQKGRSSAKSSS